MVRKLKKRMPIEAHPEWKGRLKRFSVWFGSVGAVLYGAFDVLQMGFLSLPKHLLERIPYGTGIALAIWASIMLVKLFRLRKE